MIKLVVDRTYREVPVCDFCNEENIKDDIHDILAEYIMLGEVLLLHRMCMRRMQNKIKKALGFTPRVKTKWHVDLEEQHNVR